MQTLIDFITSLKPGELLSAIVVLGIALCAAAWKLYQHFSKSNSSSDSPGQIPQGNNVASAQNVYIGFTPEQFEDGLKRKEAEVRAELASDSKPEKDRILELEAELAAVHEKLANTEQSYDKRIEDLTSAAQSLDEFKDAVDPDQIEIAKEALTRDDTKAATALLTEILEKRDMQRAEAAYQLGKIHDSNIQYEQALDYFRKAVQSAPDNAAFLHTNAAMAVRLAHYAEAEPLYLRSIEINEKTLGKDHPDVATTLNNLAGLYRAQGLYEKAEPLYLRALEIKEKTLGKDHPSVANTLNNLAGLYETQGLYDKAEPLFLRALEISEKTLGKDHPDVAITLNNLAAQYQAQGLYDKAEPLFLRDLEISEKTLGKDHPDVATTLNNLASLFHAQRLYDKVEPLYLQSLEICEKTLGKDHPNTIASMKNYQSMIEKRDGQK